MGGSEGGGGYGDASIHPKHDRTTEEFWLAMVRAYRTNSMYWDR